MSNYISKLPNILTLVRLLLVPVFMLLLLFGHNLLAFIVFLIASLTDYLDGVIARKYNAISNFGKLADPLADKILVMTALVLLVGLKSDLRCEAWVQAWMVVIILAREIWVTGLRAVAAAEGLVIPAGDSGKVKSVLQMVAIHFLLVHDWKVLGLHSYFISPQFIGECLLLISIAFSLYGAWQYSCMVFKAHKNII